MEITKLIFEIDAISGQVLFYVIKMIYQIWNFFILFFRYEFQLQVIHWTCIDQHRYELHKILDLPRSTNIRIFYGNLSCFFQIRRKKFFIRDTCLSHTERKALFLKYGNA